MKRRHIGSREMPASSREYEQSADGMSRNDDKGTMTKQNQYQMLDLILFERILEGMIASLEGMHWAIQEDRLPARADYECETAITHLYNAKVYIKDKIIKLESNA